MEQPFHVDNQPFFFGKCVFSIFGMTISWDVFVFFKSNCLSAANFLNKNVEFNF